VGSTFVDSANSRLKISGKKEKKKRGEGKHVREAYTHKRKYGVEKLSLYFTHIDFVFLSPSPKQCRITAIFIVVALH
jgi:hypothetical protein